MQSVTTGLRGTFTGEQIFSICVLKRLPNIHFSAVLHLYDFFQGFLILADQQKLQSHASTGEFDQSQNRNIMKLSTG